MALEDPDFYLSSPDIREFTSEEEVESEEEFEPTPIPSSSQEVKRSRGHPSSQQKQQPAVILRSSQQDADGTVSSTQQHSNDGSQERGSQEELRLSQALSPEDEVWMQKMDELICQCRAGLAEIERLDHESEAGEQHEVEVEVGPSQDEVESHRKVASEMRKFLELEQLFEQIQEKKKIQEKEMKQGKVGSLPEAEQRVAMLVEAKQRIGRHLEAQKKKVAIICSDPQSSTKV